MDKGDLLKFMAGFRHGVVSSVAADGTSQSALVGIAVTPDLEVVFDTLRSTRKYRNLKVRPQCSFVIGWGGEQTVQFEGVAVEPEGDERVRVQQAYFAVWTDGPSRLSWPGLTHFCVKPRWLRFSDFDQRPPLIVEMNFPAE
jgi:hypothetical protein